MLRRISIASLVAAFVIFCLLNIWLVQRISQQSPGHQQIVAHSLNRAKVPTGGEDTAHFSGLHEWSVKFLTDIKITDALLALFTFFLVIYTARLWIATNAMADADRPHLIPALFTIDHVRHAPNDQGFVELLLNYRMENHGKSPAFIKSFCLMQFTGTLEELDARQRAYGETTTTRHIVAPSGWYGSASPSKVPVLATTMTKVLDRTEIFVFFGFIKFPRLGLTGGGRARPKTLWWMACIAGGKVERLPRLRPMVFKNRRQQLGTHALWSGCIVTAV